MILFNKIKTKNTGNKMINREYQVINGHKVFDTNARDEDYKISGFEELYKNEEKHLNQHHTHPEGQAYLTGGREDRRRKDLKVKTFKSDLLFFLAMGSSTRMAET